MKTLVIGGAGCGKSELAEALCLAYGGQCTYLATMQGNGSEARQRITRHRALRAGKGFDTLERPRDLASGRLPGGTVLLECLGNLVANELFAPGRDVREARKKIESGLRAVEATSRHIVVVTNDVFCDGVAYSAETQDYIQLLGQCNARLADRFDQVVEVVCGIPIWHKGEEE